jgi:Rad3-related DNA helicase
MWVAFSHNEEYVFFLTKEKRWYSDDKLKKKREKIKIVPYNYCNRLQFMLNLYVDKARELDRELGIWKYC